ncbi:FAD binding domain-containing protein [Pseudonocardia nigra]|uniref:FAD binding domain-containing protein n=1 Tax=Pseudonocardia nigra TaxID=1921578 RepID=UPI001C5CF97A|nr:FAD binding domain-containing protein [Pseudonocardia nigra]
MKPPAFDYHRATSVSDVLDALADDPADDTKVLAGGQSLMTLMNLRLARPALLVDIGDLAELARTFDDIDDVVLGALVRHRTLEKDPRVAVRLPMIAEAARHIGHVGIRNRGTLGGALAHADPAGELPTVMVAAGATIHVESSRGRREIPAEDFFVSVFTTQLEPDELITWVTVPAARPGQGWGFVEYAERHGDYALAGAACLVDLDDAGRVGGVRAALIAAADRPLLVSDPSDIVGDDPTDEAWARLARTWAQRAQPLGDDPDYVRELSADALTEALAAAHRRARAAREEAA